MKAVTLPMAGRAVADVEPLKAVTWWCGADHHHDTPHSQLTLTAQRGSPLSPLWYPWTDALTDDRGANKQRGYIEHPVAGVDWRLEIYGQDVTEDSVYCGLGRATRAPCLPA
ncbi:MAG: hypothetical protein JXX28_19465 [Deltaproteobacteria bacterium]|nr:hypothetical protein [Deltaproteobacteria bacterium]